MQSRCSLLVFTSKWQLRMLDHRISVLLHLLSPESSFVIRPTLRWRSINSRWIASGQKPRQREGTPPLRLRGAGPASGGNVLFNRRQNIWQMRGGGGRGVSPARLTRRETFEQTKQAVNRQLRSIEKTSHWKGYYLSSGVRKNSWSVLTKCTRSAMYSSYKWSMPTTEEEIQDSTRSPYHSFA